MGLAWAPVERLLAEHHRGGRDHALKIWSLLVLDLWREQVQVS
jgi:asparagine synthase (glutamine-hydrolysing)